MDPFQWVGSSKRQHPGQQLIQGDAERVEIAAGIDRSIHAPGLFGGHIGKAASDDFGRRRCLALARQSRRDAKAGEPHMSNVVDQRVCGLHVLVYEALPVDAAKSCR